MKNNFELRIDFKNDVSFKDGQILEEIKTEIQKRIEMQCNSEIKHLDPNKLDGGITISIALAGLTISSLNLILNIVKFYMEQKRVKDTKKPIGEIIVNENDGIVWSQVYYTEDDKKSIIDKIKSKNDAKLIMSITN